MAVHHAPSLLAGWSRVRSRGHDMPRSAVFGGEDLLTARAAWRALPWPTRQTALQHAVVGRPHPDPAVAAITHRWAHAQLGVPRRTWAIAISAATVLTGLLAALVPLGLGLPVRLGLCAAASLTALLLGMITVRTVRGQAAEMAQAAQSRR